MIAKGKLSEVEMDIQDRNKETLDLMQELAELKATHLFMTAHEDTSKGNQRS